MCTKLYLGNVKGRVQLGDLGSYVSIILKPDIKDIGCEGVVNKIS